MHGVVAAMTGSMTTTKSFAAAAKVHNSAMTMVMKRGLIFNLVDFIIQKIAANLTKETLTVARIYSFFHILNSIVEIFANFLSYSAF